MIFGRKKQEKVLVVKSENLSEFVAADAAFGAIRESHPDAEIVLLTSPDMARLAKAAPYFDMVWGDGAPADKEARKQLASRIKREKFARVYDLDNTPDSARYFRALQPFAPKWSGSVSGAALRHVPEKRVIRHTVDRFADQLAVANVEADRRSGDVRWALSARKDAANMQPTWYGVSGPFVLLAPAREDEKRWPAAQYARLAETLRAQGLTPVLVGGVEKQPVGEHISRRASGVINLLGKTDLLQLSALADKAVCFVGDDTAPSQLAAAVGCPGVMLLSNASDPALVSPRGRDVVLLTADDLADLPVEDVVRTLRNTGRLEKTAPTPAAAP
ncbi:MAG: glycosyltransferase family 9 protein [Pseudomonadota bacterium]